MTVPPSAYKNAGVDIDAKYRAVLDAKDAIRATFTKGVMGDVGQFGGLFDPRAAGVEGQVLVASTDGVGTKVKVAQMTQDVSSVGEDLVNHCVDDILVQGARPLFFLDYVAIGKMVPERVTQVISGVARACKQNDCALLGGETAEMPGVYVEGEFDVAGTLIGCVQRDKILDGSRVRAGQVALALPSSGLHTNGYSLARHICFAQLGHGIDDRPDELGGQTVGEALLAVHRSYLKALWPLLEDDLIAGMAHITGGGLPDNIPRVLPAGVAVEIEVGAVPAPPIFAYLVAKGGVGRAEACRVFNMGFGMVLFVDAAHADDIVRRLAARGEACHRVGRVVPGAREVILR
ncbi:MAG: phosphoribosylformylglycinamidine cyclo-ligase [Planctomycetota bacterium]